MNSRLLRMSCLNSTYFHFLLGNSAELFLFLHLYKSITVHQGVGGFMTCPWLQGVKEVPVPGHVCVCVYGRHPSAQWPWVSPTQNFVQINKCLPFMLTPVFLFLKVFKFFFIYYNVKETVSLFRTLINSDHIQFLFVTL